jgi:aryl sulfotransferase
MQRIVSVLVFQETRLPGPLNEISPWLDCQFLPLERKLHVLAHQRHRRFIKTHLPADALPLFTKVSYIIVGRNLRDTAVSQHHHMLGMVKNALSDQSTSVPPTIGEDVNTSECPEIPENIRDFWHQYFTRSGFPWETNGWPTTSPTRLLSSWWQYRDAPNVLFAHYQDMLDNLDREMRRVSGFLGIPVNEDLWPDLVQSCTFSQMRRRPELAPVSRTKGFEFFHKGKNKQWQEFTTDDDLVLYDTAMKSLPADLRQWLAHGT